MHHMNLVAFATYNIIYIEYITQELLELKQNGENDNNSNNENITCIAMHRAAITAKNLEILVE